MSERRVTDWHTHLYLPEHAGPVWTERGSELVGRPAFGVASHADHEKTFAEAGIDRFALIGFQIAHIGMKVPNEYIGEYLHRNKGRAIGIGSVDPTQPDAADQLRLAVREWGLHGVKLSPPYQGFHPHSEEAYKVYRAAADLGIFMMFHQASVFIPNGYHEFASPSLLDKVAREFRSTKIILAHFGKPWMNEAVELVFKNRNVYADVSTLMVKPWQLYTGLRLAIEGNVTGRLLFGSDFPFFEPGDAVKGFLAMADQPMPYPIPLSVLEDILYNRPLEMMLS
jgi:predicted TIM-barrel fold metal-dependent hydrolase